MNEPRRNPDYSQAGSRRVQPRDISIDVQEQIDATVADYLTTVDAAATYATPTDIATEIATALPDGATAGDMLYWNGTAWVGLASGTGTLHNDGAGNLSWS